MLSMMRFYHEQIDRRKSLYSTTKPVKIFDDEEEEDEELEDEAPKHKNHNSIKVKDLKTGKIYESVADCADAVGINATNVSRHIRGKIQKVRFVACGEGKAHHKPRRPQKVKHLKTGIVYDSIHEASNATSDSYNKILRHIKGFSSGMTPDWEKV